MAAWTQLFAARVREIVMALFAETLSPARMPCMALVFGGIAGLKLLEQS